MSERGPEQLSGCKNGPCPKIFRWGERAAVQGAECTERTVAVPVQRGQEVVEIPIEILTEALAELGAQVRGRGGAGASAGLVTVVGEHVVVRGDADTELTGQITPGAGEKVVEVPLSSLVTAAASLEITG
jgi:hypothetical protein